VTLFEQCRQRALDANRWPLRPLLRIGLPVYRAVIRQTLPHDTQAFTQGLAFHAGMLYESTGLSDQSSLRCIDPTNGEIVRRVDIPNEWCEGIAVLDARLVQLTWTSGKAFVYDLATLARIETRHYEGEGWGLSAQGHQFLMSDGSSILTLRDRTFRITQRIPVRLRGVPLPRLNDLAWVNGSAYANVWYLKQLYEIGLPEGAVRAVIDCRALFDAVGARADDEVLNGIAYDADNACFWMTGKCWPKLFRVTFDREA